MATAIPITDIGASGNNTTMPRIENYALLVPLAAAGGYAVTVVGFFELGHVERYEFRALKRARKAQQEQRPVPQATEPRPVRSGPCRT